jgi:hypothetical protein
MGPKFGAAISRHQVAALPGQAAGEPCADDLDGARDTVDGSDNVLLGVGGVLRGQVSAQAKRELAFYRGSLQRHDRHTRR